MTPSDSEHPLRTVSYVVLGLLEAAGPQTSYDLERNVEISVGFFWPFPHSQLYREPHRLAVDGLVTATRESSGRRRTVYTITDAGRAALRSWLAEPADPAQRRDPAMLKLFFSDASPDIVAGLAAHRVADLEKTITFLEQPGLGGPEGSSTRRTVDWGLSLCRADLAFWRSLLQDQP